MVSSGDGRRCTPTGPGLTLADESHDLVDHALDRHARRIDRDGIVGADERRRRARPIAPIARLERGRDLGDRRAGAARRMERIVRAAARAFLGRGIEENLDVGVRKHDRADVASFDDDAALAAHLALLRVEHLAHAGLTRDGRGRRVDLGSADRLRDVLSVDPR